MTLSNLEEKKIKKELQKKRPDTAIMDQKKRALELQRNRQRKYIEKKKSKKLDDKLVVKIVPENTQRKKTETSFLSIIRKNTT